MKKPTSITLEPELAKRAKIQAIKDDTKLSAVIEKLLRQWLKEREQND